MAAARRIADSAPATGDGRTTCPYCVTIPPLSRSAGPDEQGCPLPTHPCPRFGREVAVRFRGFRVEKLKHVCWQTYRVETHVNWCGHGHEIIPLPLPDGHYVRAEAGGGQSMAGRSPTHTASFAVTKGDRRAGYTRAVEHGVVQFYCLPSATDPRPRFPPRGGKKWTRMFDFPKALRAKSVLTEAAGATERAERG